MMCPGTLIPMELGGHVPSNIVEFLYFAARFILSSNSNNCCSLYFNANIMCSFTKKASGSALGTPLRDFEPPDLQSSFMSLPP